jgi:hypothetical protein
MASHDEHRGPVDPPGQPPRTGRFWFDLLAAVMAIFISMISLIVSFRGERTQRELLAANSWPFLQLSKDQRLGETKLDVENAGVGPAKIYSFELFYHGHSVANVPALLQQCCGVSVPAQSRADLLQSSLGFGSVDGNVLRPGEHIAAFLMRQDKVDTGLISRFNAALPDLTFRACYCSILGECWTADLVTLAQKPVSSCPAEIHSFTLDDHPGG